MRTVVVAWLLFASVLVKVNCLATKPIDIRGNVEHDHLEQLPSSSTSAASLENNELEMPQKVAKFSNITCSKLNVYLTAFKNLNKVAILDFPAKVSTHCVPEWSTFGTCCDATSAISFLGAENRLTDSQARGLTDEASQLASAYTKAANQLTTTSKKGKSQDLKQFNEASAQVKMINARFATALANCNMKIKAARGSSICTVCSGRSPFFFSKTKLLIDEQTCRSIVSECRGAWRDILELLKLKDTFKAIVPKPETYLSSTNLKDKVSITMASSLSDFSKAKRLGQDLAKCGDQDVSKCKWNDISPLCDSFIQLAELDTAGAAAIKAPTFKAGIVETVKVVKKILKEIKDEMAHQQEPSIGGTEPGGAPMRMLRATNWARSRSLDGSSSDSNSSSGGHNGLGGGGGADAFGNNGDNSGQEFTDNPFSVMSVVESHLPENSNSANFSMIFP